MNDDIKEKFKKLLNEDHVINKKGTDADLLMTKLAQIHMILEARSAVVIIPTGVLAQIHGPDLKAMRFGLERAGGDLSKVEEKMKNGKHTG